MRLFDATTGELKTTFDGHVDQVDSVGITKDGRIGVSGALDGTLRSWDLETGAPLAVLEGHASFVRSLVIMPDDARLISGSSDRTIRHWSLERRTAAVRRTTRAEPVAVLSISANGKRVVSGTRTSVLSVWDVARGTVTGTLAGHAVKARPKSPVTRMPGLVTAVSLTEDGSTAVSASRDSTLRIWDVASGQTRHTLEGHSDVVLKIAMSANGRHAASLARDRTVRLWDLTSGRAVGTLASEDNVKAITSQPSDPLLLELGQHTRLDVTPSVINRDAELTISSDGRHVLIGDDSGVLCWDALTGRAVKERFDDFIVVAIASRLAGRAILGSRTGWIKVWDLETRATTHTFKAHDHQVLDLALTADQRRLVSAGRDNTICVWDLTRTQLIGRLQGVSSQLDAVAVAPDTRVAYSIYGDTIVASDLMKLSHLGSISFDHQITVVAIASDGTSVAAGDESGMVHFLSLER